MTGGAPTHRAPKRTAHSERSSMRGGKSEKEENHTHHCKIAHVGKCPQRSFIRHIRQHCPSAPGIPGMPGSPPIAPTLGAMSAGGWP